MDKNCLKNKINSKEQTKYIKHGFYDNLSPDADNRESTLTLYFLRLVLILFAISSSSTSINQKTSDFVMEFKLLN